MFEAFVAAFVVLAFLGLALAALVALPLILVALVIKVLVALILLPFRAVGWLLGGVGAAAAGLVKLAVLSVAGCFALLLLVGGVVLLPILPLVLLLGATAWLASRLLRSPRAAAPR